MITAPTEADLCELVSSTHAADRINLKNEDIKRTWKQEIRDPYAHGHFTAYMHILHKLLPSIDFPIKEPSLLTDQSRSHQALEWLRTLHNKMTEPLARSNLFEADPNGPTVSGLGRYRFVNTLAITKTAPAPALIPPIMHNWFKDIATYHHSIKAKVANPYGFSATDARELLTRVKEIPLFFSVVQPFSYGNQRLGRIVELAFRWAWNIPVVHYYPNSKEHNKLLENLTQYETDNLPRIIQASLSVK
jgi:hypothetical protein